MKTLLQPLTIAALSLCLVAGLGACRAEDTDTSISGTDAQQEASRPSTDIAPPAAPAEQFAEGELRNIDLTAKTFVLRDSSGSEQKFSYSDITRILGTSSAQGLTGKQGSRARVGYLMQGDMSTAIWIEIVGSDTPAQKY